MSEYDFLKQFAERLREAMHSAGYDSQRSISGVDIHRLAEITGHSVQICRKYLRGEAMPGLPKLIHLASALNVTPGWLAFGEQSISSKKSEQQLFLSNESLHYLFNQVFACYDCAAKEGDISFLIQLIQTLSSIQGTEAQTKQIIDLALTSRAFIVNR